MKRILTIILCAFVPVQAQFHRTRVPTVAIQLTRAPFSMDEQSSVSAREAGLWIDTMRKSLATHLVQSECFEVVRQAYYDAPGGKPVEPDLDSSADYVLDGTFNLHYAEREGHYSTLDIRMIATANKQVVVSRTFYKKWRHGDSSPLKDGREFGGELARYILRRFRPASDMSFTPTVIVDVEPVPLFKAKIRESLVHEVRDGELLSQFPANTRRTLIRSVKQLQDLQTELGRFLIKDRLLNVVERKRLFAAQYEEQLSEAGLIDNRVATRAVEGDLGADYMVVGDLQTGVHLVHTARKQVMGTYVSRCGPWRYAWDNCRSDSPGTVIRRLFDSNEKFREAGKFAPVLAVEVRAKQPVFDEEEAFAPYQRSEVPGLSEILQTLDYPPITYANYIGPVKISEHQFRGPVLLKARGLKLSEEELQKTIFTVRITNRIIEELLRSGRARVAVPQLTDEGQQEETRRQTRLVGKGDRANSQPLHVDYRVVVYLDFSVKLGYRNWELPVHVELQTLIGKTLAEQRFYYPLVDEEDYESIFSDGLARQIAREFVIPQLVEKKLMQPPHKSIPRRLVAGVGLLTATAGRTLHYVWKNLDEMAESLED